MTLTKSHPKSQFLTLNPGSTYCDNFLQGYGTNTRVVVLQVLSLHNNERIIVEYVKKDDYEEQT